MKYGGTRWAKLEVSAVLRKNEKREKKKKDSCREIAVTQFWLVSYFFCYQIGVMTSSIFFQKYTIFWRFHKDLIFVSKFSENGIFSRWRTIERLLKNKWNNIFVVSRIQSSCLWEQIEKSHLSIITIFFWKTLCTTKKSICWMFLVDLKLTLEGQFSYTPKSTLIMFFHDLIKFTCKWYGIFSRKGKKISISVNTDDSAIFHNIWKNIPRKLEKCL